MNGMRMQLTPKNKMIESSEIKRLLEAHKVEVEQWLNLDLNKQVQLLNDVAQGKYEPFDDTVYDLIDEAHDNIMTMLHNNAWNGDAVDHNFWSTKEGQVMMSVRLWLDGDELITIKEACEILYGSSTDADLRRIVTLRKNGTLNEYIDTSEPNPQRNKRLSKQEVQALKSE